MTGVRHDAMSQRFDADERGWFGDFGGRFMPEALVAALDELDRRLAGRDGRPGRSPPSSTRSCASTPDCRARSTTPSGSATRSARRILLKREDLNHTGAHKIRNVLGQALLTRRMGKTRVIAETGAGQHGVASATAAAYFGLDCTVYMGAVDTQRQALNVARMNLLGAKVVPVESGSATLKDAINEALRDWVASVDHTAYLFGTAAGPHPFPSMVRDFTRGIGDEARQQCLEQYGALPGRDRRVRRRRLQRDRPVHRVPRRRGRRDLRLRGRRRRRRDRPARRDDLRRGERRAARRPHLRAPGRGRPDHRVPLDLRRPRLPRRRPAARPPRRRPAGRRTSRSPTPRRWTRWPCSPAPRGSSPRSSPPTRSPARSAGRGAAAEKGPDATMLINLTGRGDKDMGTAIEWFGLGDPDGPRPREEPTAESRACVAPPSSKARADGRAALVGYLPAGFPDVAGGIEALARDGRRRLRRDRGRPALQRPGDGRPDDPGRRPAGARRRRPHPRRAPHRRGGRRDRHPDAGDDLLEPRRALRRRRGSPPTSPTPGERA